jgi:hypothetical protein
VGERPEGEHGVVGIHISIIHEISKHASAPRAPAGRPA